jgi:hypothetical protein
MSKPRTWIRLVSNDSAYRQPWWLAPSYERWELGSTVWLPIGAHLLVRWTRRLWFTLRYAGWTRLRACPICGCRNRCHPQPSIRHGDPSLPPSTRTITVHRDLIVPPNN